MEKSNESSSQAVNAPSWFLGEIEDLIDICNNLLQNPGLKTLSGDFNQLIKGIPNRLYQEGFINAGGKNSLSKELSELSQSHDSVNFPFHVLLTFLMDGFIDNDSAMYQSAARCIQAYATGNKNISQLMIIFKADAPKYTESVLGVIKHNAQTIYEIIDSDTIKQEGKFIRDFWDYLIKNNFFDERDVQKISNNHDIRQCYHLTLLKLIEKGIYIEALNNYSTSP